MFFFYVIISLIATWCLKSKSTPSICFLVEHFPGPSFPPCFGELQTVKQQFDLVLQGVTSMLAMLKLAMLKCFSSFDGKSIQTIKHVRFKTTKWTSFIKVKLPRQATRTSVEVLFTCCTTVQVWFHSVTYQVPNLVDKALLIIADLLLFWM